MSDTTPQTGRPGWPVSPGFLWRAGFIAMALVFIFLFIRFLIDDGGGVIFTAYECEMPERVARIIAMQRGA